VLARRNIADDVRAYPMAETLHCVILILQAFLTHHNTHGD
jgi:hypothetical protein